MNSQKQIFLRILALSLLTAGLFVRIQLLPMVSDDITKYLRPWYDYMVSHGIWTSLGDEFSNYTPPYLYLLGIATLTKGFLPAITAIKGISIFFDLMNACLVGAIVRFYTHNNERAFLAGSLFFLLPTILLNSAAWGQADSIYSFFILLSFAFLLRGNSLPALISFGAAIAFKAQAIFFAPFLLLLTSQKRIPWRFNFLVPVTYFMMMLPALLAGRSLASVFLVYLRQADTYDRLSLQAPNLYLFFDNRLYKPVLLIGISIALIFTLAWIVWTSHRYKDIHKTTMLACAAVSVSLTPFLLPKMHERYFYLMDIFTFLLAFCLPNLWLPAILAQFVSLLTYSTVLFSSADFALRNWENSFLLVAVAINIVLIGYLLWKQFNLPTDTNFSLE